jgi:hypothetical protein
LKRLVEIIDTKEQEEPVAGCPAVIAGARRTLSPRLRRQASAESCFLPYDGSQSEFDELPNQVVTIDISQAFA